MEALYDEKVEGVAVRARARWHEHGKNNSKCFLNLGKRNNIKMHIRKLYISGTISTDPFEIMDAKELFCSNLYKRQRTNQDSEEADLFLKNANISRLPEELSKSYEAKITFGEYENILGSFQTDKTPGNDGIPMEFYKTFW